MKLVIYYKQNNGTTELKCTEFGVLYRLAQHYSNFAKVELAEKTETYMTIRIHKVLNFEDVQAFVAFDMNPDIVELQYAEL